MKAVLVNPPFWTGFNAALLATNGTDFLLQGRPISAALALLALVGVAFGWASIKGEAA